MEHDELVQLAERALFEAEQDYRRDPSQANRRRIMRAWSDVRATRGDAADDDPPPYPLSADR